ncbi:phosducin-like protein [Anaeramoeba flamelloides]|uniref:Phosducin-like protein n=1 Tax=Anaeramoeba flamelloides TaxID=1746091 RepID=A0AAV7YUY1_9EUKA|nr:phosducin-like protein [Anaeramoeba flamelloides]
MSNKDILNKFAIESSSDEPEEEFVMREYGNTGPKGVIADHAEYLEVLRRERIEEKKRQVQQSKKMVMNEKEVNLVDYLLQQRKVSINEKQQEKKKRLIENSDPETEEEDEKKKEEDSEEELLKMLDKEGILDEYALQRLNQIKKEIEPVFGTVLTVNKENFVSTIDNESPKVTIIVHMYDQNNRACIRINSCLSKLARRLTKVKFLKGLAKDLKPGFNTEFLPVFIVYKAGKFVDSILKVSEHLPKSFDEDDVRSLLVESKYL